MYLTIINVMNKEKLLKELVEEIKKDEKLRRELLKALQSEHSERKPRKNYAEQVQNKQTTGKKKPLWPIFWLYLPSTIVFTGWGVFLLYISFIPEFEISILTFPVGLIFLFVGISSAIDTWKYIKGRIKFVSLSRDFWDGYFMRDFMD